MGLASASVSHKIDDAKRHGLLHLAQSNLIRCPPQIFTPACCSLILRLDLSANLLTELPDTISSLSNLQFLWLSDNPTLSRLPPSLSLCSQLRVLDARATAIHTLPSELARLSHLQILDIGDTPLETRWLDKQHLTTGSSSATNQSQSQSQSPFTRDSQRHRCQQIVAKLQRKDDRTKLKQELYDKLHDDLYRIERSDSANDTCVKRTIQRLLKAFTTCDEIRSVIRNAERLFPSLAVGASLSMALEQLDATSFRRAFDKLRQENEHKKRAADLELKIRALYFDRIDPKQVGSMVESIYKEIRELSEVNFLIKHAAALFPKEAKDVDGKEIARRVVALQKELAQERQAAIDKLFAAVKALYSDAEPAQVQSLVTSVAALFKNTKDLRSLAADASSLFPTEFLNAHASEIRSAFLQQKAETLGGAGSGGGGSKSSTSTGINSKQTRAKA